MIVADEVQAVVDWSGVISRTIDSSGISDLPRLRERVLVLLGNGRSMVAEKRKASPIN